MTDTHTTTIVHRPAAAPAHLEGQRMHPLVGAAMARGAEHIDPATLRDLLAVQREWEAGEARKAYTRALAALKRDLPTVIAKDATVDFTGRNGQRTHYTHASLAGVMEAITEPLTRHGFSLSWEPATGERGVSVTCRLTHAEGHSETATLEAPPDTSGNKSPAQSIASTITLLQRYSALALLGIATADMKEPTGRASAAPDAVNVERNMKAIAAITADGLSVEAAAAKVGRPPSEWTAADLNVVREWWRAAKNDRPAPNSGELSAEEEAEMERELAEREGAA